MHDVIAERWQRQCRATSKEKKKRASSGLDVSIVVSYVPGRWIAEFTTVREHVIPKTQRNHIVRNPWMWSHIALAAKPRWMILTSNLESLAPTRSQAAQRSAGGSYHVGTHVHRSATWEIARLVH